MRHGMVQYKNRLKELWLFFVFIFYVKLIFALMQKWIQRDLKTIWHPCSQMSDYEQFPPVVIKKAKNHSFI